MLQHIFPFTSFSIVLHILVASFLRQCHQGASAFGSHFQMGRRARFGVSGTNPANTIYRSESMLKSQASGQNVNSVDNIWETGTPTTVQGGSLRTWSYANPAVKRVVVSLKTDGRPLEADVELWQGPDNTPLKMNVYVEDGAKSTFNVFIDTPRNPNTVCVKNTGNLEFPLFACVGPDKEAGDACLKAVSAIKGEVIQGGALRTYPFEPNIDSVAILIKTDGRPLNSRIELLQGPNNNKQVLQLYTEDGLVRPFMAVLQTPGSGNVVRAVNTSPVEYPMNAAVVAYEMLSEDAYATDGVQPEVGL